MWDRTRHGPGWVTVGQHARMSANHPGDGIPRPQGACCPLRRGGRPSPQGGRQRPSPEHSIALRPRAVPAPNCCSVTWETLCGAPATGSRHLISTFSPHPSQRRHPHHLKHFLAE